jgi:hypothetical protein
VRSRGCSTRILMIEARQNKLPPARMEADTQMAPRPRINRHSGEAGLLRSSPRIKKKGRSACHSSDTPMHSLPQPSANPQYFGTGLVLLRAHATIDRQRVPLDVPGLVRQQEDDGIGDFLGLNDSTHRNECGVAMRVASGPFGQERRLQRPGAGCICPDAPFGVLMRYEAASVERHLDLQRSSVELKLPAWKRKSPTTCCRNSSPVMMPTRLDLGPRPTS